jgi:hypothetical protein
MSPQVVAALGISAPLPSNACLAYELLFLVLQHTAGWTFSRHAPKRSVSAGNLQYL